MIRYSLNFCKLFSPRIEETLSLKGSNREKTRDCGECFQLVFGLKARVFFALYINCNRYGGLQLPVTAMGETVKHRKT